METFYNSIIPNTFGIEARCRRLFLFASEDELTNILKSLNPSEPFLVIGAGSNLLPTGDYDGSILKSTIKGMEVQTDGDDVFVRCGSGWEWDAVVNLCVDNGYHGSENLSLIPGDVGASAVQNIGAYGVEAKDIICRVEAIEVATGRKYVFSNADCQYAYRYSRFKADWRGRFVITYVTYRLSRTFLPKLDYGNIRSALAAKGFIHPTAKELRETIIAIRRAKLPDPKVLGNGGSFFMNPIVSRSLFESLAARYPAIPHYDVDADRVKIPAAWLIEQCGWKGRSLGRAGVYERQPLVLVNLGGATGQEVLELCRQIQIDVKERFGIEIHPEVNMI